MARLIGLPVEKIRVQYYAGSNTYGSSCYRDAAQAAAIMSQEVGKPVRLQFSREDEFGWDNYGPALLSDLRGAVDAERQARRLRVSGVGAHRRRVWRAGHGIPARSWCAVLAGGHLSVAAGPGGAGLFSVHLSQMDMYDVPNRRIVNRRVAGPGYLRTGPLCARRWIRRRSSRWKG